MPYPSTVTTFTNPNPTDRLNSPSHSSVETVQNTGLTELMTFVGTLSSAAGTLIYDIRSANSNGGGHVQTANKGGTGQTSYTKGDLLVAQSSSVLIKLAVGVDGQRLVSDSSVAAGVKWATGNTFANKISTSNSVIGFAGTNPNLNDQSILSVSIPGSTLGTTNAVRATVFLDALQTQTSVIFRANYGSSTLASIYFNGTIGTQKGFLTYNLIEDTNASTQSAHLMLDTQNYPIGNYYDVNNITRSSVLQIKQYERGSGVVNSSAAQTMGITVSFASMVGVTNNVRGHIVEKIS